MLLTGKTHILGGSIAGVSSAFMALQEGLPNQTDYRLPLLYIPGIIIAAVVGGVFPDIDWHTSQIGALIKPLAKVINVIFGHRTLFHSPILYILTYTILTQLYPQYYWLTFPFCIGAASHLMLDIFNKKGISLFYPYSKRYYIIGLDSAGTGEVIFRLIMYPILIAAIISFTTAFANRLF